MYMPPKVLNSQAEGPGFDETLESIFRILRKCTDEATLSIGESFRLFTEVGRLCLSWLFHFCFFIEQKQH